MGMPKEFLKRIKLEDIISGFKTKNNARWIKTLWYWHENRKIAIEQNPEIDPHIKS